MRRQIITIDEELCNGCGKCIPGCPEGALRIVEGKARLVSDRLCDGLGACIGECPMGAIHIEEREAVLYDEEAVMGNIVHQGDSAIQAHLRHLSDHRENEYRRQALEYLRERGYGARLQIDSAGEHQAINAAGGCPGSRPIELARAEPIPAARNEIESASELRQWPIQLQLINPHSPYFKNADLLIAADCVPFSFADFHRNLLKGRRLVVFCPKLDKTIDLYVGKLAEIFKLHDIASVSITHMEVPCCFGVEGIVRAVMEKADMSLAIREYTISMGGGDYQREAFQVRGACPGARTLRTPEITLIHCPACGARIEMFTDEVQAECASCGRAVHRRLQSCTGWCPRAAECLGKDVYLKPRIEGKEGL